MTEGGIEGSNKKYKEAVYAHTFGSGIEECYFTWFADADADDADASVDADSAALTTAVFCRNSPSVIAI